MFGLELVRQFLRQGPEKLRELEELMSGAGLFTEDFDIQAGMGLGDFLDVEDPAPIDGEAPNGGGGDPRKKAPKRSSRQLMDNYLPPNWSTSTRRPSCPSNVLSKKSRTNGRLQTRALGRRFLLLSGKPVFFGFCFWVPQCVS